jgi:hypothetical protein
MAEKLVSQSVSGWIVLTIPVDFSIEDFARCTG